MTPELQAFWKMAMNLSGIDAGTILDYPKPTAIPSAGYEKAKNVLLRLKPVGEEKTAEAKPKKRRRNPLPSVQQTKSFGGHVLGGAAAGRFAHDWVEGGIQSHRKTLERLPPKYRFLATSAGAGLGFTEYTRKRIKKHFQEKAMKKQSGVSNLGAEEAAQIQRKVVTRTETRAETEALFSQTANARAKEQRKIKGLFSQAEGAETEAPLLAKTGSARCELTAATDAFFEKLSAPQQDIATTLYPELLKVASDPSGRGTPPTPIQTRGAVARGKTVGPVSAKTTNSLSGQI